MSVVVPFLQTQEELLEGVEIQGDMLVPLLEPAHIRMRVFLRGQSLLQGAIQVGDRGRTVLQHSIPFGVDCSTAAEC